MLPADVSGELLFVQIVKFYQPEHPLIQGIYVFGERYRRSPFSREVLANMIYGPSYISLDYALH
jgi:hypothetical protein